LNCQYYKLFITIYYSRKCIFIGWEKRWKYAIHRHFRLYETRDLITDLTAVKRRSPCLKGHYIWRTFRDVPSQSSDTTFSISAVPQTPWCSSLYRILCSHGGVYEHVHVPVCSAVYMTEPGCTSQMLAHFYQTTWRYNAQTAFCIILWFKTAQDCRQRVRTNTFITITSFRCSIRFFRFRHEAFKAQWWLYAPRTLTVSTTAFCIYGFRLILPVNSDYFLKQR
jgi:hypothetical protein